MKDFRTALELRLNRKNDVKVERPFIETKPVDGCPESLIGDLRINRYCRKQPLRYQKLGGEYVDSYSLCPPKGYRDNWERCPYR